MEQKIIVVKASKAELTISQFISQGWFVKYVVAEQVACADSRQSGTWESGLTKICGEFCFILERSKC